MYQEKWKLTDEEVARIKETGGDIREAQKIKRQAYTRNGGVILNPDALNDLYEALKGLILVYDIDEMAVALKDVDDNPVSWGNALRAIAKAERE